MSSTGCRIPSCSGYFRQDLLETRFLSKGRRIDLVQLWNWFDDQLRGIAPLLIGGKEVFLNIQDKDLEKVRKRIEEIQSFFPRSAPMIWTVPSRQIQVEADGDAADLRPASSLQASREVPQDHRCPDGVYAVHAWRSKP